MCDAIQGVVYPAIRPSDIHAHQLPIPPLPEQHRIVAAIESHLSRLDAAVAALERVNRNLARYRASVLHAAVTGRLVPTEAELARAEGREYEPASALLARILVERRQRWEEVELAKMTAAGKVPKDDRWKAKYKEPVAAETEGLGELPEGWAWASVEQLASDQPRSIQSGPFGSALLHSEFQSTGKLVIGIDNVMDGHFTIGTEHRISDRKFDQLARFQARPLDLAVTVMATIGRCCIIPESIEPSIITKHVYRVTLNRTIAEPTYVMEVMRSPFGRQMLLTESKGQTRPGLNGSIIKAMPIPLSPLPEQRRIVAEVDRRLSVLGAVATVLDTNFARLSRLRQAIFRTAFEGRLVDQDPNDEPASALLERIRAERATDASVPRRRRRGARQEQLL